MKVRFALLALTVALSGVVVAVGCGDDDGPMPMVDAGDGTMDAGPGMTDGALPPPACPPLAPPPDNQMGSCCWRASNASQLTAPELRLAGLKINNPASLGSTIIRGLLQGAFDEERFNWLVRVEGAPATGMGPIMIKTGLGFRDPAGTFAYAMNNAPMPGALDRWDPKSFAGTMDGETFSAPRTSEVITLPIFSQPDDAGVTSILFELPLRNLEMLPSTLSEDRSCVGLRNPASYDTMSGHLRAYLTVADTSAARLDVSSIHATICMLIAGMSSMMGNCSDYPQSGWMVKPDSLCDAAGCISNRATPGTCMPDTTCNAWELNADFAAQGVSITN